MSQETNSTETFNQRINIIIAIVVAVVAVLGSLITKLENEASTQANKASIAEQQYYYQAIGKQISGKADVNYAFGTVYQLWYQYEVQMESSRKRGEEDSIEAYQELKDATARTSSLFDPQYFDVNTGKVNLTLYEADVYHRELYELEEKQLAANEVASAWDDKSNKYVLQLTLLAVAGFLLGLALMTKARISTFIFSVSGILMVAVISVSAYRVFLIPIIERPADAISAFAEGASLRDQKDWDKSIVKLSEAIEASGIENPYERAFLLRAEVHTQKGNFAEAIADYQVAIASGFTSDPTIDASLIQAYFYIGDFKNAIQTGNSAIQNSPDNLVLRQQLNMATLANGDTKTATEQVAILLEQAADKVKIQRQLGDNNSAAEIWWLLNDAAHQYDQLIELLRSDNASSPVKENIADPIMVGKTAEKLAAQLRAGAMALKYNIPSVLTVTGPGDSTSPARIEVKQIIRFLTPDNKYVYKVDMEFAYSGLEAGQLLSIVTYRNGIEEPSWNFSNVWTDQQKEGAVMHTLSPSYSSLYIVPPGLYTAYIYLNDDLLSQAEFIIDDPNAPTDTNPDNDFAFNNMLDQFDLYASDNLFSGIENPDGDYYSYDPLFFFADENNYLNFLEDSYDYYTDYCTNSSDLTCFTGSDSDEDGVSDEYDYCPYDPGPANFDGCPVSSDDADGDGILNDSDACITDPGPEDNYGCPLNDSEYTYDYDGDGVFDDIDFCIYDPGPAYFDGCPVSSDDADGDGIFNDSDACISDPGPEENYGCPLNDPLSDFDSDGVLDDSDFCMYDPGPAENYGCPLDNPVSDFDDDGIPDDSDACIYEPGPADNYGCPVDNPVSDSDDDGIPDDSDVCMYDPGPADNYGCPVDPIADSDGDGISDYDDSCPYDPGPFETGGCPDSDGDGISDYDDGCPYDPGSFETGGCPDSDGDGISDYDDGCPYDPGSIETGGCPDADGDGVPDYQDECLYEPGPAETGGCP